MRRCETKDLVVKRNGYGVCAINIMAISAGEKGIYDSDAHLSHMHAEQFVSYRSLTFECLTQSSWINDEVAMRTIQGWTFHASVRAAECFGQGSEVVQPITGWVEFHQSTVGGGPNKVHQPGAMRPHHHLRLAEHGLLFSQGGALESHDLKAKWDNRRSDFILVEDSPRPGGAAADIEPPTARRCRRGGAGAQRP